MRRPITPLPGSHRTGQRRGISLIELVVLISLIAVVAGSSCILIARMMQSNRNQADTLVQRRTMHLWQLQFQQDGREAQSARLDGTTRGAPKLEFQLPEGRVVMYQVADHALERYVDGTLAARWACGPGTWDFSLLESVRIARAEFRPSAPHPHQDTPPQGNDDVRPSLGAGIPVSVDVALATSLYRLNPAGAR